MYNRIIITQIFIAIYWLKSNIIYISIKFNKRPRSPRQDLVFLLRYVTISFCPY